MSNSTRAGAFARKAWLVLLALLALVMACNLLAWSANTGLDASGRGRYSPNEGAIRILKRSPHPLNLRYFVSKDRPKYRSNLKRDVIARLRDIASVVGDTTLAFDPERDVIEFEDTAAASAEAASLGLKPIVENTATQSVMYYSALRIDYLDAPRPTVIPISDPFVLEYELVARALRLQQLRPLPPSGEAALRQLPGAWRMTWVYGQLALDASQNARELPPEKRELQSGMEQMFEQCHRFNPNIETIFDNDPASPLRQAANLTSESVERGPAGARATIRYYSQVVIENGLTRRVLRNVKSADGLLREVTALAWEMDAPRSRIGILQCAPSPSARSELEPNVERRMYMLDRSPEARLAQLVQYLDYDALKVFVDARRFIPHDELSLLIVPRPSGLDARQRYEIEGYLASGGTVLVLGGEWHLPLLDAGLSIDPETLAWNAGEVHFTLAARRIEGGLGPTLETYGLRQDPRLLLATSSTIPYRIYGAAPATEPGAHPAPILNSGRLGIVPFAVKEEPPHLLAREVESFSLRGGGVIELDERRIAELGLRLEVLMRSPADAVMLADDGKTALRPLFYGADIGGAEIGDARAGQFGVQGAELSPAGRKPVAVMLSGQFPFDPDATPPQFATGERIGAQAPGVRFHHRPGRLVYVSSPDCFEELDARGWREGEPTLIGDSTRSVERSSRRFLANVLDYAAFGEELIEVRSGLLPPPARHLPYTASERGAWTVLNIALVPVLALLFGLLFALMRARRRTGHLNREQA